MRTAVSSLELIRPRDLHDALVRLQSEPDLVPLAGCTDIYVALNAGVTAGRRFIDLWPLDELRGIRETVDGTLVMGALTTYADLIASPLVKTRLPMLVEAARQVGASQIHNRGTLGGNIGNASPAGDTLPVLAVSEASVVLASAGGRRRVAFTSYYTGYRTSVRRPDEVIAEIEVPAVPGRQWFRKVGARAAQAISKVVVAAVRCDTPRIALGSVAPTVVRARRTEAALAAGASVADAQLLLLEEIAPIDDVRSTAAYRQRVAANLIARFWADTA